MLVSSKAQNYQNIAQICRTIKAKVYFSCIFKCDMRQVKKAIEQTHCGHQGTRFSKIL